MGAVARVEPVAGVPQAQPQPSLEDVQPLLTGVHAHDVALRAVRHVHPQRLHAARGRAGLPVRPAARAGRLHLGGAHDGVPVGDRLAEQLRHGRTVDPGERQQHRQRGLAPAGLQPGQMGGRQPGGTGGGLQREGRPAAQVTQVRGDRRQRAAGSLPGPGAEGFMPPIQPGSCP
ncbi:hypothetical protein GCM10020295_11980 [Streptomyces cinereospinus]